MGDISSQELITFLIKSQGAEEVARAFDGVTKGMKASTEAQHEHTDASEAALESSHKLGRAFQVVRSELGLVSPELAALAESFHIAASEGNLLAEALGITATGGLIVGGVIGALTLYLNYTKESQKETAALAKETEKASEQFENFADKLNKLAAGTKAIGERTVADLMAEQNLLRQLDVISEDRYGNDQRGRARALKAQQDQIAFLDSEIQRKQHEEYVQQANAEALGKIDAADARKASLGVKSTSEIESAGKGPDRLDLDKDLQLVGPRALEIEQSIAVKRAKQDAEQLEKLNKERNDEAIADAKTTADIEIAILENKEMAIAQILGSETQTREAAYAEMGAAYTKMMEQQRKQDEAAKQAHEKEVKAQTEEHKVKLQFAADVYAAFAANAVSALQQAAHGQAVSVKQIISGIGDTLVAYGTQHLLEGGIKAILGNPLGAIEAAQGAAEIAVGLGMGALSSGHGGGAPGGGASGRFDAYGNQLTNREAATLDASRAHSPLTPSNDPSGNGSYQQPVNIYFQSTMSPTPRDAVAIQRAVREGQRQGYV